MGKINKYLLILAIFSLNANILLGYFIYFQLSKKGESRESEGLAAQKFPFLSKRIFIEDQNDILINFVQLREKLKKYSDNIKDHLGFYFEYLPSGVSIGINEKEEFIPASLLKVPLVMEVYKQIEKGKLFHNQEFTVKKEYLDRDFGNLWQKGEGTKLTLDEAVRLTLTESDNTAKNVLFYNVPQGTIEDIFDSLDIPVTFENEQSVVTPKNYASILRSLYLSSYLTVENSNQILEILTQSKFDDKIAAGIPQNIKIAHKIGLVNPRNADRAIYTDCGIIYPPKRPYILCIMAQTTEAKARLYMKDISQIIYNYVSEAVIEK